MKNLTAPELSFWDLGYQLIAGVDEAGRGPLAGPVVAAACIFPKHVSIAGIGDSKALSHEQRERVYEALIKHPEVIHSVAFVDVETIDRINILQATFLAMQQAVMGLSTHPELILVDGNRAPLFSTTTKTYVKGDALSQLIGAASIFAKVTRDRYMRKLHEEDSRYGFDQHKGYGTKGHIESIVQHGLSPFHRKSFHLKALKDF